VDSAENGLDNLTKWLN